MTENRYSTTKKKLRAATPQKIPDERESPARSEAVTRDLPRVSIGAPAEITPKGAQSVDDGGTLVENSIEEPRTGTRYSIIPPRPPKKKKTPR